MNDPGRLSIELGRATLPGPPSSRDPAGDDARPAPPTTLTRRLGGAGLLTVAMLVLVALFADFVASDLPIACSLRGTVWVLPNVVRPAELERVPRAELAREARWAIPALVAHGPRLGPGEVAPSLAPPSAEHPFGTDREGRDVFARTVHGTRSYLAFAFAAVMAAVALGGLLGAVAGLFGGALDALVSRVVESVSAFPPLVLVIGIQAAVARPTLLTLFLAIALTRWPEIARLVRGEVILAATQDYVLAARALGATPLRVLRRHIMPNVVTSLVVASAGGIGGVIVTEASLDFLRIGQATDAASWGETMSQFRDDASAWWLLAFPGALLVVTVAAYGLVGEALRNALDPRA